MKFFHYNNKKSYFIVGLFLVGFISLFIYNCSHADVLVGGGPTFGSDWGDIYSWNVGGEYILNNKWDFSGGFLHNQKSLAHIYYLSVQREVRYTEGEADFFLGLGVAGHTGGRYVDQYLPLPVEFSLSGGVDIANVRIVIRHISNAGIKQPNNGMNWAQILWNFK